MTLLGPERAGEYHGAGAGVCGFPGLQNDASRSRSTTSSVRHPCQRRAEKLRC